MKIDVVTLFPSMVEGLLEDGVVGQAIKSGKLELSTTQPRDFTEDVHKTVDDRPFGGGDGMLMMATPLDSALKSAYSKFSAKPHVIYLSPQGRPLNDAKARELAKRDGLVFVCGRYAGVDQRVINRHVDEELSIGDYVLSGGELAAMVTIDALARFIPGVLGNQVSSENESLAGGLLEEPQFTRPREVLEQGVPEFLLSGDHKKIEAFKKALSVLVTYQKRPDLWMENGDKEDLKSAVSLLKSLSDEELEACGLSCKFLEEIDG